MGRLWGVVWALVALVSISIADTPTNPMPPRTPTGMLWAGTTFQLRASVSVNNQVVALSSDAQVRVGKLIRWQWQLESPTAMAVPQGQDAIFRVRLTNMGNGWDNLTFAISRFEIETPSWQVDLFEDRLGNGQVSGSPLANGVGSLIDPGSSMRYLLRLRPPASSVPTDGAWATLIAQTSDNATRQLLGEFVAGVVRQAWVPSRAWSGGVEREQRVMPILHQGWLVWMYYDTSRNETRIGYTRDAVEATQGGTLGNEARWYPHVLRNFVPAGFSIGLGNGWFVGANNQLVRIDVPMVLAGAQNAWVSVSFPAGVQPRLDVEPVVANGRLYVAGSDGRIHAIAENGMRTGQSAPIPATYGSITSNLVASGRVVYAGTQQGWVVQVDLLTGNLRTARRIAMQPVQGLAVGMQGRVLLARVGTREVHGLHPEQLTQVWRRMLPEDIVSPVATSTEREVGVFLTRSGMLYALNTRTGVILPHYPQRLFGDVPLARASVGIMRRQDRQATYVYVLGQLQRDANNPQALFRVVTLENPYNRLEYQADTMRLGSDYLQGMLFTGNRQSSYCLVAARRDASSGGTIAAIPLR